MPASLYSKKGRSRAQEDFIANCYLGNVSRSSGAADADPGDVRTKQELIECKQTGSPEKPAKSFSIKVSELEKIVVEAQAEGREPALAVRIHNPDSVLSDRDGNIDMMVRLVRDDAWRYQYGQ